MSASIVHDLQRRWFDLTSFMEKATRAKWWKLLLEHYEPRPFHGLAHLEQMMNLFDEHKDRLNDRYAVAFAIFFKK
jgi:predicted metal-dependent HD superfamily phosphohydrolase